MGHHYVPQEYLRGFAASEQPGTIWMYDKQTQAFKRIPIRAVVQEADFYDQHTEAELNSAIEGPAQTVLSKLRRRESISSEERLRLAVSVATLLMRVPVRRRWSLAFLPGALGTTVSKVRKLVDQWSQAPEADQNLVARRRREIDQAEIKFRINPPDEVISRLRSPWPSEIMVTIINAMTWRIALSEVEHFLTSDNPAHFFSAFGIGGRASEVTFPLSSKMGLFASWQGERESLVWIVARPALVRESNRRIASAAERFILSREKHDWIRKIATTTERSLSRIQWEAN